MKKVTVISLLLLVVSLSGIGLNLPVSALMNGCANIALLNDQPSVFLQNPALVNPGLETTVSYLFNLPDLPFYGVHFNLRFGRIGVGSNLTCIDHPLQRELTATTGLNLELNKLKVGFSGQFLHFASEGYSRQGSFTFNSGISWQWQNFKQSFSWLNITASKLEKYPLPVYLIGEFSYSWDDKVVFALGLEKEKGHDFSYRCASSWWPFDFLGIVSGYQYQPERLGLGLLFKFSGFRLDYSIRSHKYLDYTHYLSLGYEISHN